GRPPRRLLEVRRRQAGLALRHRARGGAGPPAVAPTGGARVGALAAAAPARRGRRRARAGGLAPAPPGGGAAVAPLAWLAGPVSAATGRWLAYLSPAPAMRITAGTGRGARPCCGRAGGRPGRRRTSRGLPGRTPRPRRRRRGRWDWAPSPSGRSR